MPQQRFVSILIPCYNAGPWVAQCIQSALDQTYPHKEVVVIDDGSSDNSLEIIRGFGDRIRIETQPNRGGNITRNRLVELSKGEWLEFLDADDFLLPRKIESQVRLIENDPALDAVYAPVLLSTDGVAAHADDPVIDGDVYANYFRWSCFSTIALLLKKEAVLDVGGWNEKQEVCQEHELVLRLLLKGKRFALAAEALAVNRLVNQGSVSRRSPLKTMRQKMELLDRLEDHLTVSGAMTLVRQTVLAQTRFLGARMAYPCEPGYARSLYAKARAAGPLVAPATVNPGYLFFLRLFGFDAAERIAGLRRKLFSRRNSA